MLDSSSVPEWSTAGPYQGQVAISLVGRIAAVLVSIYTGLLRSQETAHPFGPS